MDEQLILFDPSLASNKHQSFARKPNYTALNYSTDVLDPELQLNEKEEQKARQVLGSVAKNCTEEQINEAIAEMKYLAESWLSDFEREIFDGKTLKEMLHDKGSL